MNKLALGAAQFGMNYGVSNVLGQVPEEDVCNILSLASLNKVDVIDTAISYGDSESILGKVGVGDFKVVTKVPSVPKGLSSIESWIEAQVEGSLTRLGLKSLYGLLLHCSTNLQGVYGKQIYCSLKRFQKTNIVNKIGISVYNTDEISNIVNIFDVDLVQAPFSIVDQRLKTSGWMKRLHANGVEVHTRSAFLQGLLLMSQNEMPQRFHRWVHFWSVWRENLARRNVSAVEACLSYPLSLPEISRVIVGVESVHQFQELVRISNEPIQNIDWSMLISDDDQLINPSKWSEL